jgi:hypothetical protein
MGWHGLEEAEYLTKLDEFVKAVFEFQGKKIDEAIKNDTDRSDEGD